MAAMLDLLRAADEEAHSRLIFGQTSPNGGYRISGVGSGCSHKSHSEQRFIANVNMPFFILIIMKNEKNGLIVLNYEKNGFYCLLKP